MSAFGSAVARRLACALLFLGGVYVGSALAHKPSDSYLSLSVSGSEVRGQWDIALRDLDHAIGLDTNDDGAITWDEVRTREAEIGAYALARLRLSAADQSCPIAPAALMIDHHSDGAYAALALTGHCRGAIQSLTADYRLFFDLDPQHRGLMQVAVNGITHTAIFSAERPLQQVAAVSGGRAREFLSFVQEGIWHIWIGFDHLLFLCALLLPAMLVRTRTGWEPVPDVARALWNVLKIVTAFTVAHSITLALAVFEVASVPSRWVESAIAASVLLAALNNIYPVVTRKLWLVAFAFGLVHGFGFASVLLDLGVPRQTLLVSLLGFNLGVEAGQLAIVGLYFLLAYGFRSTRLYRQAVLAGGSGVVAVIATGWMIERALDLKLFSP